ncbi:membrane bound sugar transport protein [Synechocystis sp. PCC 6803]|jgi:alpha-glucoside transport system permease protein|uniref:Osmoprotective compounds uptake permease protein GgtD n=1 Tax=Synechocystis sp. (strain ATCC 27184 / PCC 6803 / Kazusa) TaxID=1111708 RepID=GGTD_SYNY3|nr:MULTISPECIES: carbohydrate ABC transporter permease [unclassified Synechocystis]Q55473.1 RecName: Full=Osmoprotective compounds uptake permease protein GgtD [Synechocystis sp. PCC 6803 substr. Kazusa]BAM53585.1 sugar ABC transporter membrane protein [Synechocystis sp. PCC 6803] [Bacillus subtilis BEST7613]AGF53110.1 membrane bound sugar transport protein [Synechocystis sp. PCC 6803]ALJ68991.1 sugar ABC transporter permease [Synechocystis sp. PCC 6803]AVP90854.1 carbohydrate ABC transporter 
MTKAVNKSNRTNNTNRKTEFWQKLPIHIAILTIAFIWTLPSLGLFISSLRPRGDMLSTGWWTVFWHPLEITQFYLGNYGDVLRSSGMGEAFLNSLTIAVPATVIPIAIATFAAYAFAWMTFPGRQLLFILVVCLLVVPLQTTLIPVLRVYAQLGLAGTFLGVWLAHTAYGLPLGIYLLRNYIGALPKDLIEAAAVDGASHLKIFTKLIVPLSMPAIASFAVFQFLWVWNDLLVALVYLGGTADVAPVTIQLSNLVGSRGQDWYLLTAGAFISMIVPLMVFFGLQRYFVRGILAGSVKS